MMQRGGAGRAALRGAAPIALRMVKDRHPRTRVRHKRVLGPLTDCSGAAVGVRALAVCCGLSLRSAALPRIGELPFIADYHEERPGAPAAAAERRAASTTPTSSCTAVANGGGLRLLVLCGRRESGLLASASA